MKFRYLFLILFIQFGILFPCFSQVQPLSRHDSALVVKYLKNYENELNIEKNIKEATRHLNETAFLYWEHNQYDQAIEYYEMSLELNTRIANENGQAMLHNNLGMLYSDVGNYEKSYEYFNMTLAARRAKKEKGGIISALINKTIVLNNLNRFDESSVGLEEALVLAREMNDPAQMRSCYGMLSETYEKAGNAEKSMYYFELYRTFNDMIQREEVAMLRTELKEEQLVSEIEKQKNQFKEDELDLKREELSNLKSENEKFDLLIEDYDSVTAAQYESLGQKQLELELLKKESEISSMEMREETAQAESKKEKAEITKNFSILIILSLMVLLAFIIFSRRKIKMQAAEILSSHNELLKTQEDLIKSEKMAAIGVLTAGIAHEINNPLNFIYNGALALSNQVKKQKNGSSTTFKPFMDIINEGVSRCSKIISSLGHISRSGEKMDEDCDIHSILDNSMVIMSSRIPDKVKIEKNYFDGDVIVRGNGGKLHQAVMNIIANAFHAMENRTGVLTLSTNIINKVVILEIKDTGIGMPPEFLRRLGDPFFTTKPPGKGTGLGMYITFSIISEHEGEMKIESELERFTSFKIHLPAKVTERII